MGKNIHSIKCLFMGKIIRSPVDFLYVKGNRFSAHKLTMIRQPSGTYYLTYNVTLRQLDSGCLGSTETLRDNVKNDVVLLLLKKHNLDKEIISNYRPILQYIFISIHYNV